MHQVLRQLLTRVQTAILHRPRRVLVVSVLLVVVALALGAGVEFRSSRSELVPPGDPDQRRWAALLEEYRGSETVVACVEALPGSDATPEGLRSFADRLAAELRHEPLVDQVFHRFDVGWLLERSLFLLPAETLEQVESAVAAEDALLSRIAAAPSLTELNRLIAERIETGFASGAAPPAEGAQGLPWLVEMLRAQRRFLEDPDSLTSALTSEPPFVTSKPDGARQLSDGYLKTHDGTVYFVLVTPSDSDDGLRARRRLLRALRTRAETVERLRPGFRVVYTGQPAMTVEEMDTVRRDTWLTAVAAILGVSALTFAVFRWRTHALLVLASLAMGVAWAFGAVRLELGYLNLITSSFISTLIGIGVAYGVHPMSEYELGGAHTRDPRVTVRDAFQRTGAGVTVAAVTTAVAFFSIQLMRFRGFSELGLVAGVGVLLCLAAAMISLPALMMVYSRGRRRRDRHKPMRAPAMMDSFWVDRVSSRVCSRPRLITALALALTVLAGWAALGLEFNSNLWDLFPRNAESLRYQRKLVMESDLSPLHNVAIAADLEALEAMRARAEAEPTIDRFESVARFLPADVARSRAAVDRLAGRLERIRISRRPAPLDGATLTPALARLETALLDAQEAAFSAGLSDLVAPLDEALAEVEASRELASAAGPDRFATWNEGQRELYRWARTVLGWARDAARMEPPTLETLPAELRQRFLTRSGKPLAFLFPAGSVFDSSLLESYVAASRRVSPEATGFPVVFHKMTQRITSGFYGAVGVGLLLVALILIIDYKRLRDALLALLPLAMGVIWMLGAMRLLGISFNFANLVAIPLILGVGIDNGVHVIHRVRLEGRDGMGVVLRHTGRAILIASLTTMVGFGSLALASHRGMASLGFVLLLGVGSCLVTSTWVLPNILVVLGLVER